VDHHVVRTRKVTACCLALVTKLEMTGFVNLPRFPLTSKTFAPLQSRANLQQHKSRTKKQVLPCIRSWQPLLSNHFLAAAARPPARPCRWPGPARFPTCLRTASGRSASVPATTKPSVCMPRLMRLIHKPRLAIAWWRPHREAESYHGGGVTS
jgi:hypothetical protein